MMKLNNLVPRISIKKYKILPLLISLNRLLTSLRGCKPQFWFHHDYFLYPQLRVGRQSPATMLAHFFRFIDMR